MEIYNLKNNIEVFYVTAVNFPEGIEDAYKKLYSILPENKMRNFFGISYPNENGNIIYKAAAEALFPGESEKYNLESFTIKKGDYISEKITNWKKDVSEVSNVFQKLLQDNRINRQNGYCLEMYVNDNDMICLVPIEPSYN